MGEVHSFAAGVDSCFMALCFGFANRFGFVEGFMDGLPDELMKNGVNLVTVNRITLFIADEEYDTDSVANKDELLHTENIETRMWRRNEHESDVNTAEITKTLCSMIVAEFDMF